MLLFRKFEKTTGEKKQVQYHMGSLASFLRWIDGSGYFVHFFPFLLSGRL